MLEIESRMEAVLLHHQIHNQFHLVQALEVSQLGLITASTRVSKALTSSRAPNSLLTEEVGFGFFLEVGFEDAGVPPMPL